MKKYLLMLLSVFTMSFLMAQERTITGTISDAETGETIPGVNIVEKGTSNGTVSDFDGNYRLTVGDGATLVFTFIGYAAQEVAVGSRSVIDVALALDVQALQEVVVIGYGSVKKSDLTGSVVQVGERELNKGLVMAPDQLIQGKAAGVQVINNSGQPGGATTVRIRGNASIRTGNQPLFVVDGVQLTGISSKPGTNAGDLGTSPTSNPLNFINPADIESIQVLKDASATAIYGSRGANGVVIVTTKKGKEGSVSVNLNSQVGFSNVLNEYDILDGNEYRAALSDYGLTGGDYGDNVDAFDEITRTGITQNHNVSFSGGNADGTYRASFGFFDQEGIVEKNDLRRVTANLSGTYYFLNDNIAGVDLGLIATNTIEDGPAVSTNAGFRGSLIGNALQWNPTHPLYNNDGTPVVIPQFGNFTNPVALLDAYHDRANATDIIASITPFINITDNLTYRLNYNVTKGSGTRRARIEGFLNIQGIENRGLAAFNQKNYINQIVTHTLNFDQEIADGVNLQVVAGYEFQSKKETETGFSAQDFIIMQDADYTNFFQNSTTDSRGVFSTAPPEQKLSSWLARGIVNISDKYLITASFRADGSSKFGENNQYGFFPSVAFAWNLHNESFFSTPFNDFKLRLGWGQTGNSEFEAGAAQERWAFGQQSIFLENVANPDLQWETSTTINAGIDFSLLDYTLTASIDYFTKETVDLLFQQTVISPGPSSLYWINLDGKVVNSGLEIALNYEALNSNDMLLEIGANVSFLSNELTEYSGANLEYGQLFGQGISNATIHRLEEGQPLNAFYLSEFDGIENGVTTLKNNGERAYVGDPNQDVIMGATINFEYQDFSVNLAFNGAYGHDIYNNTLNTVVPIGNLGTRNIAADLLSSNQESTANPIAPSSRYLENGNYTKLNNATISYNIGAIGDVIKNARVYITGSNLFVITDYTGFDPEVNTVNTRNGLPSYGIEYIPYPSARTIMFGTSITF